MPADQGRRGLNNDPTDAEAAAWAAFAGRASDCRASPEKPMEAGHHSPAYAGQVPAARPAGGSHRSGKDTWSFPAHAKRIALRQFSAYNSTSHPPAWTARPRVVAPNGPVRVTGKPYADLS